MSDQYADKVWPITVPKHPELKLGDRFTMDVPCDPETGAIAWSGDMPTVLMTRQFVITAIA